MQIHEFLIDVGFKDSNEKISNHDPKKEKINDNPNRLTLFNDPKVMLPNDFTLFVY